MSNEQMKLTTTALLEISHSPYNQNNTRRLLPVLNVSFVLIFHKVHGKTILNAETQFSRTLCKMQSSLYTVLKFVTFNCRLYFLGLNYGHVKSRKWLRKLLRECSVIFVLSALYFRVFVSRKNKSKSFWRGWVSDLP